MPEKFKSSPEEQRDLHREVAEDRPTDRVVLHDSNGNPAADVWYDKKGDVTSLYDHSDGAFLVEEGNNIKKGLGES